MSYNLSRLMGSLTPCGAQSAVNIRYMLNLRLPDGDILATTMIFPGHGPYTNVKNELLTNPFIS